MRKRDEERRRGLVVWGLALFLVTMATVAFLPAQAADDPKSGDEVLAKVVEAMGGRDALQKLHNRVTYGRMEIPAMGLKMSILSYAERPSRTHTLMKSEALGTMEEGGDGELYWEQSAMAGPKLKKGPDLARSKRESDFDGLINWKNWYASAELKGTEVLDGKPAWKLVMTPKESGDTTAAAAETLWVDQASALPVKQAMVLMSEQGKIPVESFMLDYRKVGGVQVPFHLKQSLMKGVQVMEIYTDSLKVDAEIPAGTFDPPAEVKALIEKEKAGAAPAEKP